MDYPVIRRRVVVRGRVQGVGFRWSTRTCADALGVTGFARNLVDGAVAVEVEGPEPAVRTMVEWLREGPPSARVSEIEITERDPEGSAAFTIA